MSEVMLPCSSIMGWSRSFGLSVEVDIWISLPFGPHRNGNSSHLFVSGRIASPALIESDRKLPMTNYQIGRNELVLDGLTRLPGCASFSSYLFI